MAFFFFVRSKTTPLQFNSEAKAAKTQIHSHASCYKSHLPQLVEVAYFLDVLVARLVVVQRDVVDDGDPNLRITATALRRVRQHVLERLRHGFCV